MRRRATLVLGAAAASLLCASAASAATVFPSLLPSITGPAGVGGTLVCNQGAWPGGGYQHTFSWARDNPSGDDIRISPEGENARTYVVQPSDAGTSIHCNEAVLDFLSGNFCFASSASVTIPAASGGEGGETPAPTPAPAKLRGTARRDVLRGTAAADVLRGLAGNDRLIGRGADDRLYGGPGADVLDGGPGADFLHGGPGRDKFRGGPGPDRLDARDGAPGDRVACGGGRDVVRADRGDVVSRDCERVTRTRR